MLYHISSLLEFRFVSCLFCFISLYFYWLNFKTAHIDHGSFKSTPKLNTKYFNHLPRTGNNSRDIPTDSAYSTSTAARGCVKGIRMSRFLLFALLFSLITVDQTDGWRRRRRRRRCSRVNCAVTWGSWSSCSWSCGAGIKYRLGKVTRQPACGGSPCPALRQFLSCNSQSCRPGRVNLM